MAQALMTKDNIVLNACFSDKWEAIEACGNILLQQGYVKKEYIDDMIEREKVATVYVGNHVAIPHGVANSEKNILESGISFIQIPSGVDFDGEKAYAMFGIAGKDGAHIEILSDIAIVCMDTNNVEILRTTADKEHILKLFSQKIQ
ncbi:MAG TPA: PTS sugar transporter subunit IIA [Selenomonadales bacterium]|nr:PTS sugar transporter subunit IIA [Selenomonadales bacterium]